VVNLSSKWRRAPGTNNPRKEREKGEKGPKIPNGGKRLHQKKKRTPKSRNGTYERANSRGGTSYRATRKEGLCPVVQGKMVEKKKGWGGTPNDTNVCFLKKLQKMKDCDIGKEGGGTREGCHPLTQKKGGPKPEN